MARKRENNRYIISTSRSRRPYGSKIKLLLEDHVTYSIDGECSLLVTPDIVIRIKPSKKREVSRRNFTGNIS